MSCSLQERADKQGKTSLLWDGADTVVVEGWGLGLEGWRCHSWEPTDVEG